MDLCFDKNQTTFALSKVGIIRPLSTFLKPHSMKCLYIYGSKKTAAQMNRCRLMRLFSPPRVKQITGRGYQLARYSKGPGAMITLWHEWLNDHNRMSALCTSGYKSCYSSHRRQTDTLGKTVDTIALGNCGLVPIFLFFWVTVGLETLSW